MNVITFLGLFCASVAGLEVDEKLTARILKVSQTKKTILLNRGTEDGLVVGDHAKLFLTSGVVARATVVKSAPTRSIWSVYRFVDRQKVYPDKVVSLKITSALKLTKDASRDLQGDKPPSPTGLSADEQAELASLEVEDATGGPEVDGDRLWELWGTLQFNTFSVSSELAGADSPPGKQEHIGLSVGLEKYLRGSSFENFSLNAFFHHSRTLLSSLEGDQVGGQASELGAGINWHYMADALSRGRLIGFAGLSLGFGSVRDNSRDTHEGASRFFSAGSGLKYAFRQGPILRVSLDYYRRAESYLDEDETGEYAKTVAGLRLMAGLGWRF